MCTPATFNTNEIRPLRLFSFKFIPGNSPKELVNWFWDGYLLIAHWLNDADFTPDYYELPKVQEFLRFFALSAQNAFHETLDDEEVWDFLRLCEDTHDAILEHNHRPR